MASTHSDPIVTQSPQRAVGAAEERLLNDENIESRVRSGAACVEAVDQHGEVGCALVGAKRPRSRRSQSASSFPWKACALNRFGGTGRPGQPAEHETAHRPVAGSR